MSHQKWWWQSFIVPSWSYQKLLEKFEEKIEKLKKYGTPTTASSHFMPCIKDQDGLSDEEQQEFRSGVGSLLYLLKHSRPDLSNFVWWIGPIRDQACGYLLSFCPWICWRREYQSNLTDIFTKNLSGALFQKHSDAEGMEDGDTISTTPKIRNRKGVKNMVISHFIEKLPGSESLNITNNNNNA
jgi:hypothetical protein